MRTAPLQDILLPGQPPVLLDSPLWDHPNAQPHQTRPLLHLAQAALNLWVLRCQGLVLRGHPRQAGHSVHGPHSAVGAAAILQGPAQGKEGGIQGRAVLAPLQELYLKRQRQGVPVVRRRTGKELANSVWATHVVLPQEHQLIPQKSLHLWRVSWEIQVFPSHIWENCNLQNQNQKHRELFERSKSFLVEIGFQVHNLFQPCNLYFESRVCWGTALFRHENECPVEWQN